MPASPPITPLAIPKGVKTIILFGGTFDPPHHYHADAPRAILERLFPRDAIVVYVPAARNPLKAAGPIASDAQRLAMLRLAIGRSARRRIWTDELDRASWLAARARPGPSYMADTLRRLRSIVPRSVRVRLLIGADQAATFHSWRSPRRIIALAPPIVLPRAPILTRADLRDALPASFWTARERAAWCASLAPIEPLPASSTNVRRRLARAPRDARRWARERVLAAIPAPVARYIARHGLYRAR